MLANNEIEKRFWESADRLRDNSNLGDAEYSVPVLGLIFLRYADHEFEDACIGKFFIVHLVLA